MKSSFRTTIVTILAIATPLFLGTAYLLDATNELALSVMITLFIGWQIAIHAKDENEDLRQQNTKKCNNKLQDRRRTTKGKRR